MSNQLTVCPPANQRQSLRIESPHRYIGAILIITTLLLASLAASAQTMSRQSIRSEQAVAVDAVTPDATAHFSCELRPFSGARGLVCYGPAAIRAAYGVDQLIANGTDGRGQTIVIIDAYGSPSLEADLTSFDTLFGVPAPPSIQQIHMAGSTPFNFSDNNQLGWAEETSLDVQWAHAIAPGANIIVVAAATNSDEDILAAQNYAIDNRLGHVISESFGSSETALVQTGAFGAQYFADNEASYKRARRARISVMVSSGDSGPAEGDLNGNLIPVAASSYPASSPLVTAVGGTNLFFGTTTNANPNGTYQGEVVWNDGFGAGGSGISTVFKTPNYQKDLPWDTLKSLKKHRAYPDVSYNAGVFGGVIVHLGFLGAGNGFYIFGGTSAGAPQWAGLVSLTNQMANKPIGFLNKRLYEFGEDGDLNTTMHDILVGNNNFAGITGFSAAPSWDLATGWGTPSVGLLNRLSTTEDDDSQ